MQLSPDTHSSLFRSMYSVCYIPATWCKQSLRKVLTAHARYRRTVTDRRKCVFNSGAFTKCPTLAKKPLPPATVPGFRWIFPKCVCGWDSARTPLYSSTAPQRLSWIGSRFVAGWKGEGRRGKSRAGEGGGKEGKEMGGDQSAPRLHGTQILYSSVAYVDL